jgi:hypothetical protein
MAFFRSVTKQRLDSNNRLAWALRAKAMDKKNWQAILDQTWPYSDNWPQLDYPAKWQLYHDTYGSLASYFWNNRIRHEQSDLLDQTFALLGDYYDQYALENQLTGKAYPPETRGIPWGIKEILRIMRKVDNWDKCKIPDLPDPKSSSYGEAVNEQTKATKRKASLWQDVIEYASSLDLFCQSIGH